MKEYFRITFGNPLKRNPTNFFSNKLGFGLSFFGAALFGFIRITRNEEYNCNSFNMVWHTGKIAFLVKLYKEILTNKMKTLFV